MRLGRGMWFTSVLGVVAGALAPAGVAAASPPQVIKDPWFPTTGQYIVGETVQANGATWAGEPTPAVTFQWLRCDWTGDPCLSTGATGGHYVITAADVGYTLRVRETAT